jgi:hypothetical protein
MNLHKEWCKQNFVAESLEIDLVFRATIKPAYQRRIPFNWIALWFTLSFLSAMGGLNPERSSPANSVSLHSPVQAMRDICLPLQSRLLSNFAGSVLPF